MALDNIFREMPNNTMASMVCSGAISCLASFALKRGDLVTMAAIGALAAFVHACSHVVLNRLKYDAESLHRKTDLPAEVFACLQAIGSVYLTRYVVKVFNGPSFDARTSAIIAIGMTFLTLPQNMRTHYNIPFVTLA